MASVQRNQQHSVLKHSSALSQKEVHTDWHAQHGVHTAWHIVKGQRAYSTLWTESTRHPCQGAGATQTKQIINPSFLVVPMVCTPNALNVVPMVCTPNALNVVPMVCTPNALNVVPMVCTPNALNVVPMVCTPNALNVAPTLASWHGNTRAALPVAPGLAMCSRRHCCNHLFCK
jgi:hypothetical protein